MTSSSRADLADAVVDFLPAKAIAGLSVVAKPLREAQARVVHAAARRRNRSEAVTRAAFQALEAGEVSHFRETWNDGRARWTFLGVGSYFTRMVESENAPPRLELCCEVLHNVRQGLTCQFSEVGRRLVRFRVQVFMETTLATLYERPFEVGCVAITGSKAAQLWSGYDDFGTGICIAKEPYPAPVSLKWFNNSVYETLVEEITLDEVYTVDASFFYLANPREVVAEVSVNGGSPVYLQCDIEPVNFVHLCSQDDNLTAQYGDIDVWYEPATLYGTDIYEPEDLPPRRRQPGPYSPISPDYTPTSPPYTPPVSPAHELPPTPTSPPPTGWDSAD